MTGRIIQGETQEVATRRPAHAQHLARGRKQLARVAPILVAEINIGAVAVGYGAPVGGEGCREGVNLAHAVNGSADAGHDPDRSVLSVGGDATQEHLRSIRGKVLKVVARQRHVDPGTGAAGSGHALQRPISVFAINVVKPESIGGEVLIAMDIARTRQLGDANEVRNFRWLGPIPCSETGRGSANYRTGQDRHDDPRIARDGSNKPVASAGDRFNESRIVRSVAEGAAQFFDGSVQAIVKFYECIGGPEPLANLLPCDQFTGMFEEHGENLKGLLLEPDSQSVPAQDELLEIGFECSKSNDCSLLRRHFHTHCLPISSGNSWFSEFR